MSLNDDDELTRGVIFSEVLARHIRAALAERVRSCIPARVEKFDASTQKANVKPLIGTSTATRPGHL